MLTEDVNNVKRYDGGGVLANGFAFLLRAGEVMSAQHAREADRAAAMLVRLCPDTEPGRPSQTPRTRAQPGGSMSQALLQSVISRADTTPTSSGGYGRGCSSSFSTVAW
jgi:hypothetical protein